MAGDVGVGVNAELNCPFCGASPELSLRGGVIWHSAAIACSVYSENNTVEGEYWHAEDAEAKAVLDPDHDWRVEFFAPLYDDTASLLEEVYASEPMLQAAPGEPLQFQSVQTHQTQVSGEVFVPFLEKLSQADRLRFRKARREAASRISDHLARTPAPPSSQPPADSDYGNILSWLEGLAGPKRQGDKHWVLVSRGEGFA